MARANVPDRVRVKRGARKARYDRDSLDAVLDHGLFGHLAFVDESGHPCCIPMLYARAGDTVYVHGSSASRLMRTLARGATACLTVTILHGLVLARSVFEHSANYESAVVFGRFRRVVDEAERLAALEAFTEKLLPGRWSEVRSPNRKELKATMILAMPIEDGSTSVKVRTGPPDDDDSVDAEIDTWAGVVPIVTALGEPQASPGLRAGIPLAESVSRLLDGAQRA
jgi:nitroimidazol reductase NimA-like FMN-containing flavoprotein (pyridoxamine 5'-phosphate oxidase superfamily)